MNEPEKFSVLFVDDESRILEGLRRQLRPLVAHWELYFANSGAEALEMLRKQPVEVVVTDMRMPEMSGLELLEHVHDRWPETARIILSGQTEQSEILSDVGVIHQFLQKPCEPETLRRAITRTAAMARLVEQPGLRKVISGLRSLPVLADSLCDLMNSLNSERSSVDSVAAIVATDVGLSAKLLQLVNSAFFGHPRRVSHVKDAVSLIGLRTLRQVAIAARTFESIGSMGEGKEHVEQLWLRSADLAAIAARAAHDAGQPEDVQARASLAASLSLIGRAIIARYLPKQFHAAMQGACTDRQMLSHCELAQLGVTQQIIGAYALGLWGFDDDIIRAVAYQASPEASDVQSVADPLVWLHVARCQPLQSVLVEAVHPSRAFLDRFGSGVPSLKARSAA